MTTIACNRETMAADQQSTAGSLIQKTVKLHKVKGDIIGMCGPLQDGYLFIDWYKHKGDKPIMDDDFGALVLTKDGEIIEYGSKLVGMEIHEDFCSIGSGSHFAIGAMEMGADPVEAVKVACKWDAYTKGPVKKMRI